MQFKHPEILWALFLLLIPILIHLFQLRRFQKTPFTNVAMLQKVVSESRKSNNLKKWLLLFTRLLLLAALVVAFAQPFTSSTTAFQNKETVIYLDNSFSMQAKSNGITLLQKALQDLIKNFGDEATLSLFTNESTFRDVNIKKIQNNLLSTPYTHRQLTLDQIEIKAQTLFSESAQSVKNLIVVSDFQQRMAFVKDSSDTTLGIHYVAMTPKNAQNMVIDAVELVGEGIEQSTVQVSLSGGVNNEDLPVSLYNDETLIAKSSAKFNELGKASISFTIPSRQIINGRLQISDNSLAYDNQFFFNIDEQPQVNVLAISNLNSDYLDRLFTKDEFDFVKYGLTELDYSALDKQHVVILDGLNSISTGLQSALRTFRSNGGTLVIIPSSESDLNTYNQFLSNFGDIRMLENLRTNARITSIAFQHPLYKDVFKKQVGNFQYPMVEKFYRLQSKLPNILQMEGSVPFLVGDDGLYIFSASLELTNSNFKNSPLIVPTFYNMGVSGMSTPEIYHMLGQQEIVDIDAELLGDQILKVSKAGYEFIPQQQRFSNRIRAVFDENPAEDGIFTIHENEESIRNISFNFPRDESILEYLDLENQGTANVYENVASLHQQLKAESSISAYWKWFVILALLLALLEVIIQKFAA